MTWSADYEHPAYLALSGLGGVLLAIQVQVHFGLAFRRRHGGGWSSGRQGTQQVLGMLMDRITRLKHTHHALKENKS